jgi:hypothetical protein
VRQRVEAPQQAPRNHEDPNGTTQSLRLRTLSQETLLVQPSVVPELALAQSATRPIHWMATATAVAAVVAGSSLVPTGSATAQADAHHRTRDTPAAAALPAPGAHSVAYPLECGPTRAVVATSATGDLDGDGRPETVSVVHCDAGSGTPPSGVYVVTAAAGPDAEPRVVATLVDPADRQTVTDFAVHRATVTATLLGYSSADVPRCCPDERSTAQWQWRGGAFVRSTPPQARNA